MPTSFTVRMYAVIAVSRFFTWDTSLRLLSLFLVRIKVTCPADRHVVADARSTEAKVKWSEDDFEVESSNPVRWVQL